MNVIRVNCDDQNKITFKFSCPRIQRYNKAKVEFNGEYKFIFCEDTKSAI